MYAFRPVEPSVKRQFWLVALASSGVAALVYALTLADYVFPGESARLLTQWAGMEPIEFPAHSLWGWITGLLASGTWLTSTALRVNLLSFCSGVLGAGLFAYLMMHFVWYTVNQEDSIRFARGATIIAGISSAFAFIFSTAVWQASSHLEYRIFDVTFALLAFVPVLMMAARPNQITLFTILVGILVGIGLVESVIFVALLPVYILFVVAIALHNGRNGFMPAALCLFTITISLIISIQFATGDFLGSPAAKAGNFNTSWNVVGELLSRYVHEIRLWFSRSGWLFVILFAVLPFVACGFAAGRGLNNDRRWSQYLFHIAMTICVILGFATPLAPESLLRPWGIAPVATSVLIAATIGYLLAYWLLLARVPLQRRAGEEVMAEVIAGRKMAPVFLGILAFVVGITALINAFSCTKTRGAFADICANEIVERLGSRTWFVTDGLLDAHLRAAAATKGKELNLICLHRDMDDAYLKEFAEVVRTKKLQGGRANLEMSIQLGILPFLQDWFAGDPDVMKKVAIFGVPDFWYMAERIPAAECMFFGGVANNKAIDGKKALEAFKSFWAKMEKVLTCDPGKGSRHISTIDDPVVALRLQLRRHVGFVANNLAVNLQDVGMNDEAFQLYELILKTIDPDNISALFNEFEMARNKHKLAMAHRQRIEKQLKAIVDDPKRRYVLWSLSRYYGYIRSPEIFARMGYAWARSGQTGNAIAQVQRAIDFVPTDRRAGLLNMMAAIYAGGNDMKKSREVYESVLAKDSKNHDALMGLARLSLKTGALDEAKKFLGAAARTASKESSGFEWALLHLMNNDLIAARVSLQKVTDIQPKSLQAWSLLAGVLLQQYDQAKEKKEKTKIMEELDSVILPRMESIADSPRDYFVQITRALVLMRKGPTFRKQARDAFVVAAMARPDVTVTGDMILNLDIQMDDGESAERHARLILRRDRRDKLANYVMGSLRLKEGDYSTAETFLRLSVAAEQPLAAAQNDLAETLRRLQRYEEAEKFARDAVKTQPELYVAWETLGSTLLDQNKNLDESESCVKKAISLSKDKAGIEDIRMQITLARVQIAKGELGRARGTLRNLRSRESELSGYDRGVLEKLLRSTMKK